MALTAAEERIAQRTAQLVLEGMEQRGIVGPAPGAIGLQVSIKEVAKRKGCGVHTVRRRWRSWGLRKVGRDGDGFLFCGASVVKHLGAVNDF